MSTLIDIKSGQWVLSFTQPYGPYDSTLAERLEHHAFHHWMDTITADEQFFVLQVDRVMPKTFTAHGSSRMVGAGERLPRSHVIAARKTEAATLALRDKFFAIGVETADRIHEEMCRRAQKFADREQAKAVKKIHRAFPHIFRQEGPSA